MSFRSSAQETLWIILTPEFFITSEATWVGNWATKTIASPNFRSSEIILSPTLGGSSSLLTGAMFLASSTTMRCSSLPRLADPVLVDHLQEYVDEDAPRLDVPDLSQLDAEDLVEQLVDRVARGAVERPAHLPLGEGDEPPQEGDLRLVVVGRPQRIALDDLDERGEGRDLPLRGLPEALLEGVPEHVGLGMGEVVDVGEDVRHHRDVLDRVGRGGQCRGG